MAERLPGRGYQAAFDDLRIQRTLSEYPGEWVMLECAREGCGRKGKLSKARLLAENGNVGLVDLLNLLAKDCGLNTPDWQGFSQCQVRFGPELLAAAETTKARQR